MPTPSQAHTCLTLCHDDARHDLAKIDKSCVKLADVRVCVLFNKQPHASEGWDNLILLIVFVAEL